MTFFESAILGVVQGLTEWLPVSSSGHIFIVETFFNLSPSMELAAWLHGGSLLAVLIYYRKRILKLFIGVVRKNENGILGLKIICATLLSVIVILMFGKLGTLYQLNIKTVAITLGITGLLILFSEYLPKRSRNLSWVLVVVFGIVQGLAVLPGISRSGLTIALLLSAGVSRKYAVDFSFMAAIPLIFAALIFSIYDFNISGLHFGNVALWAGFIIAFLTSFFGIHYMRRWIERGWIWFAPYCFILAIILFII